MTNIDPINEGITDDIIKVSIAGREFSLSQKQAEQVVEDLNIELHKRFTRKFDIQATSHRWPYLPDSLYEVTRYFDAKQRAAGGKS